MSGYAYIGIRKSDGSIRAMCMDMEGYEKDTAKIVSDWIAEGKIVERITAAELHERMREPPPK